MCIAGYKRAFSVLILSLSLLYFSCVNAWAAAVPAYNGRMNNAIQGVVVAKLKRMGFAANDPRIGATMTGMGAGLTALSVAVGVVSWPVALGLAGFTALVSGGIYLANSQGYELKFEFNGKGQLILLGKIPGEPLMAEVQKGGFSVPPLVQGGEYNVYKTGYWDPVQEKSVLFDIHSSSVLALAYASRGAGLAQYNMGNPNATCFQVDAYANTVPRTMNCDIYDFAGNRVRTGPFFQYPSGSPHSSSSGYFEEGSRPGSTIAPLTYNDYSEFSAKAPDSISEAAMSKPVTAETLAAAANAAWKASSDSAGAPWSPSDPITPAEVSEWMAQNPASVPTVGDFFAPAKDGSSSGGISFGGGSTSPSPGGGGSTNPNPQPDPDSPGDSSGEDDKEDDWGPDPGVGAPGLEAIPTTASILDPIFNLMPSIKNFAVPSHQAECPVADFSVYGRDYRVDTHCQLLEQNRGTVGILMMLVFSLASLFIVLRA